MKSPTFRIGQALSALALAASLVGVARADSQRPTSGQRATVAKQRQARMVLNRNLVQNGSAETFEEGGWAAFWTPANRLETSAYGQTAGEWDVGVSGAPGGEERYFRLAVPEGEERIEFDQWVTVDAESMAIDSSKIRFSLSAWVGGIQGDPGSAALAVQFVDAAGMPIGGSSTTPVASEDLPGPPVGAASLVERKQAGTVPKGTRRVHVVIIGINVKLAECNNCSALGLADKLSLILARATGTR